MFLYTIAKLECQECQNLSSSVQGMQRRGGTTIPRVKIFQTVMPVSSKSELLT